MNNVEFIQGNAFDVSKMTDLVKERGYDVIVDFMIYNCVEDYSSIIELYMTNCKQYVCLSTSSVYSQIYNNQLISETTPRLVDNYSDDRKNDVSIYHILKSRLDDLLLSNKYQNFTLIRPYITFNTKRLPMVTYPKEVWLYRVLNGKKVVLPHDVMNCTTTISFGGEVANAIASIIGKPEALGEIVNVASYINYTWEEVIDMYSAILPRVCGKQLNIHWVEEAKDIYSIISGEKDLYIYDRLLTRRFDTSKLDRIAGKHIEFTSVEQNLEDSIKNLLNEERYNIVPDPIFNGYMDKIIHDYTPLSEFSGLRGKILYLVYRYKIFSCLYSLIRRK